MKKNKVLITLLIICILIIVGLGCTVGYLVLNDDSKKVDKDEFSETLKPEQIKVGQVGTLSQSATIINYIDENGMYVDSDVKLVIRDSKLFLEYNGQSKEIDVNGEKIIRISEARNCSGNNIILVLTENGNIYTWYDFIDAAGYTTEQETESKQIEFKKINTNEKIYGIEVINPKYPNTCTNLELYAYTEEKTRKYVNVVEKTLGETYEERYPYEDYFGFGVACLSNVIYRYSDGRITFGNDEFIKYEGKELKIKNAYSNSEDNNSIRNVYLVSNTNKVYLFTTNEEFECQSYELKDIGKVVSFVNKEEYTDAYGNTFTRIMLNYTDGTNSEVFNEYMNENFK